MPTEYCNFEPKVIIKAKQNNRNLTWNQRKHKVKTSKVGGKTRNTQSRTVLVFHLIKGNGGRRLPKRTPSAQKHSQCIQCNLLSIQLHEKSWSFPDRLGTDAHITCTFHFLLTLHRNLIQLPFPTSSRLPVKFSPVCEYFPLSFAQTDPVCH